jgi:hypothetical protein
MLDWTSLTKVDACDMGTIKSIHGWGRVGPGWTRLDQSTKGRSVLPV